MDITDFERMAEEISVKIFKVVQNELELHSVDADISPSADAEIDIISEHILTNLIDAASR